MNDKVIKDVLKAIGLPLGIVMVFSIMAILFYLYRSYLETKKLSLEIVKLDQQNSGVAKCSNV